MLLLLLLFTQKKIIAVIYTISFAIVQLVKMHPWSVFNNTILDILRIHQSFLQSESFSVNGASIMWFNCSLYSGEPEY